MAATLFQEDWLTAELRILEADYEKSKLQVHQDTLTCKRSITELDLLCKKDQLLGKIRANKKLKEHESRLQENLERLTSDLTNTNNQLRIARSAVENETLQHQSEKKDLEDKLRANFATAISECKESAQRREDLLQEEIENWKEKHIQVYKEADALRTELDKKQVEVESKAIQTQLSLESAILSKANTCDAAVQVQGLSSGNEDDETPEKLREVQEWVGERVVDREDERETEIYGKGKKTCPVDEGKQEGKKTRIGRKRKGNPKQNKEKEISTLVTGNATIGETSEMSSKQFLMSKRADGDSSYCASKDYSFPFTKTPARLQRKFVKDSENKICSVGTKGDDTVEEVGELINNEKSSNECFQQTVPEIAAEKLAIEIRDNTAGKDTSIVESTAFRKDHHTLVDQQYKPPTQNVKKKGKQKRAGRKKGNKKNKKTEKAISEDDKKVEVCNSVKECKDRPEINEERPVLRSRMKSQVSQEKENPIKEHRENTSSRPIRKRDNKSKPLGNKKAVTNKVNSTKNLNDCNHISPPEDELLSQQTKLSSNKTYFHRDTMHISTVVISCQRSNDGLSKQSETEVPGELDGFKSLQRNPLRDYKTARESASPSANRMSSSEDSDTRGSFENVSGEMKSSSTDQLEENPSCFKETIQEHELPSNDKIEPNSGSNTHNTNTFPKQDSSAPDIKPCSTVEVVPFSKQNVSCTTKSGIHPAGLSATQRMSTDEKENTATPKATRRKRKATTSEHETLADLKSQQSSAADISSVLDCTRKRKMLYNAKENSTMPSFLQDTSQVSFANTTLSKSRSKTGIPPSLSAFMRSFIAPKLKKPS